MALQVQAEPQRPPVAEAAELLGVRAVPPLQEPQVPAELQELQASQPEAAVLPPVAP